MVLDDATRNFLELFDKLPKMQDLPIADSRAGMVLGQSTGPRLPVLIDDRIIPHLGKPGAEIFIRIIRPPLASAEPTANPPILPGLLYFHGGGWVLGDRNTHDRLIREIAVASNVALIFVEYTRSPEVRFPYALEEGYAALQWVAQNAKSLNIDPTRLAIAGDSAGANLATVICQLAKQRNGPKLNLQILLCPNTDAAFDTPSHREFEHGPFLTRADMQWFLEHYLGGVADPLDPMVSPLRTPLDQLRGLPPALVITAEYDPLRDEGEEYANMLTQAGVPVAATRTLGTIHSFMYPNALVQTTATTNAVARIAATLRSTFLRPT